MENSSSSTDLADLFATFTVTLANRTSVLRPAHLSQYPDSRTVRTDVPVQERPSWGNKKGSRNVVIGGLITSTLLLSTFFPSCSIRDPGTRILHAFLRSGIRSSR